MKKKFYHCKACGNILGIINDSGVTPMCCSRRMEAAARRALLPKNIFPSSPSKDNSRA